MSRHDHLLRALCSYPETLDKARSLLREAQVKTAPGSGLDLGPHTTGLPAICAYIASKRLQNNDVSRLSAQEASCLKKSDFETCYYKVDNALCEPKRQRKATGVGESANVITYEGLVRKYALPINNSRMGPCFKMAEDATRAQKDFTGVEGDNNVRLVIFWYVCKAVKGSEMFPKRAYCHENGIKYSHFDSLWQVIRKAVGPLKEAIRDHIKKTRPPHVQAYIAQKEAAAAAAAAASDGAVYDTDGTSSKAPYVSKPLSPSPSPRKTRASSSVNTPVSSPQKRKSSSQDTQTPPKVSDQGASPLKSDPETPSKKRKLDGTSPSASLPTPPRSSPVPMTRADILNNSVEYQHQFEKGPKGVLKFPMPSSLDLETLLPIVREYLLQVWRACLPFQKSKIMNDMIIRSGVDPDRYPPWIDISKNPEIYYDTEKYDFRVNLDNPDNLNLSDLQELAFSLAKMSSSIPFCFHRYVKPEARKDWSTVEHATPSARPSKAMLNERKAREQSEAIEAIRKKFSQDNDVQIIDSDTFHRSGSTPAISSDLEASTSARSRSSMSPAKKTGKPQSPEASSRSPDPTVEDNSSPFPVDAADMEVDPPTRAIKASSSRTPANNAAARPKKDSQLQYLSVEEINKRASEYYRGTSAGSAPGPWRPPRAQITTTRHHYRGAYFDGQEWCSCDIRLKKAWQNGVMHNQQMSKLFGNPFESRNAVVS